MNAHWVVGNDPSGTKSLTAGSELQFAPTLEYFSTFYSLGFLYQGIPDPTPFSLLPEDVTPEPLRARAGVLRVGPTPEP